MVDRFSTAEACNIAMGIFLPCAERVLDIYRRVLEFVTSGKWGFTYCSKKKEVWKVLKKRSSEVGKKTGEQRAKTVRVMIRLLHSDWVKVPSSKLP